MKILIAVSSPKSYILFNGYLNYLVKQGCHVYFACPFSKDIEEKVIKEGAIFIPLAVEREINLIKDFQSLVNIFKIVYQVKPNIIHVTTPKAGLLFMLSGIFFPNSKKIFTLAGLRSDTLKGLKLKIVSLAEMLTAFFADKVIVVSPSLMEHAINRKIINPNKSIVINKGSANGVNVFKFKSTNLTKESSIQLRKKHAIPSEAIILGYLGRIVKDKGIVELVQAFKKIENFNLYLVLTGDFESGDPVPESTISDLKTHSRIRIIPNVDDVVPILEMYDVLILNSFREGFGNVIIEAAAMSKPVIVSDIPGARDTVENNKTGLLVDPSNVISIYRAITTYMENPNLILEYGNNGRVRVEKDFSNEVIWKGIYEFYKNFNQIK